VLNKQGLSKKISIFYCEWFDPTIIVGTKFHSQYNIVEVKLNGRYALYDPFILSQKARQTHFVNYPKICKNLRGWCVAITTKPRAHVQVDHVEDELPYQADESPTVLPVLTIELVQGLADTTILEVLDDDPIELVDDDTYEELTSQMKLMNKMTIMTNNIQIKSTTTSNIYYCLYTKLPKPFKIIALILILH